MVNTAVILAGGKGTRLKTISGETPKPLVPVGDDKVFLDWILDWLEKISISRVILSLCYRPEAFDQYLEKRTYSFGIDCVVEPEPLDTGGAVGLSVKKKKIKTPFAVLNGDTYARFDFSGMVSRFHELNCKAMIALSYVSDTRRYGKIMFDGHRAKAFQEKINSAGPGWINNGCYLLKPEIFSDLTGKYSIERDLFPDLCRQGELFVYPVKGAFIDIGTPEEFSRFQTAVVSKEMTQNPSSNI
jgi:D-glycero-alpha-D-manno-heptose 1-phosphate guanylyltransferase